ncbi:MAG: RNA-guided endonuclease InsQ/TnpB family protein [Prochloraceae cyanobacterium]
MEIRRAYKFELKPKVRERILFAQFAGCCRLVWNKALALQKTLLENKEKILSYNKLAKELVSWKQELPFLKETHSQPLQQTLMQLARAIKDGFDKKSVKRFPRFKKKGQKDSFRYPQGFKVEQPNSRLFLPKIGWVGYINSREIIGTPRNITISKRGDKWFASIQVEYVIPEPIHPCPTIVGGDRGIARFLTLSNGEYFELLNAFKRLAKKLAKLQRQLAKKTKFSNNWKKLKSKIIKLHIKIANSRFEYLQKLSTNIAKNHSIVVLEDLKVTNMSASAKGDLENPGKNVSAKSGLNRSILDQGWHAFEVMVHYKLAQLGGKLVLITPRNTSRCCPKCGYTEKDNRKSQAKFSCQKCGYSENADFVAAKNILAAGHAVLACGESPLGVCVKQEPAPTTLKFAS